MNNSTVTTPIVVTIPTPSSVIGVPSDVSSAIIRNETIVAANMPIERRLVRSVTTVNGSMSMRYAKYGTIENGQKNTA